MEHKKHKFEDGSTTVREASEEHTSEDKESDSEDISDETVMADLETKVRVLEAANTLKDKIITEKNDLLKDKEDHLKVLQTENLKLKNIVNEMKDRIECQVCFILPKQGPVPMCPNGHFICTECKEKNSEEGKVNCPTCQEPLGEIKSLLAKTVIENVKHECDLEGCEEMVHHTDYKKHQDSCDFRLIICPGSGNTCNKLVPICNIETHTSSCKDVMQGFWENSEKGLTLTISEHARVNYREVTWKTKTIKHAAGIFFFKIRRQENIYELEVVMKGSPEDCQLVTTEISVLDQESENAVFTTCFHPRPIDTVEWGKFSLLVAQDALAMVWKQREDTNYAFKVAVKIKDRAEKQ